MSIFKAKRSGRYVAVLAAILLTFGNGLALAEPSTDENTLAPPLLMGQPHAGNFPENSFSLFESPFQIGTKGSLVYQKLSGARFRIQSEGLKNEAAIFWLFEKPMDLRDRTVALHTVGKVPSRIKMFLNYDKGSKDSGFDLFPEDSEKANAVYFKMPDRQDFGEIRSIRFSIDPEITEAAHFDFIILGLNFVPEGEDPIKNLPATDAARFDFYGTPFEPSNRLSTSDYPSGDGSVSHDSESVWTVLLTQ